MLRTLSDNTRDIGLSFLNLTLHQLFEPDVQTAAGFRRPLATRFVDGSEQSLRVFPSVRPCPGGRTKQRRVFTGVGRKACPCELLQKAGAPCPLTLPLGSLTPTGFPWLLALSPALVGPPFSGSRIL